MEHVSQVVSEGGADAVAVASMLHYGLLQLKDYADSEFQGEGNVEFLRGRRGALQFNRIETKSVAELKRHLLEQGIECRSASSG